MELDEYISKQKYDAVKLAALDFLTQQANRAMPPRSESMAVVYHMGAKALLEGLRVMFPDARDARAVVSRLFAGSTPQQQAQRCRKVFSELHNKDLYADWERRNLLSRQS